MKSTCLDNDVVSWFLIATIILLQSPLLANSAYAQGVLPWATNTIWQNQVQWLLNQQLSCQQAVDDLSPCNRFVGKAITQVWGYTDFQVGGGDNPQYMSANDIAAQLLVMNDKWQLIGTADIQANLDTAESWANQGNPVIAVRPDTPMGHVALVLPGSTTPSGAWGLSTPNAASFFYARPADSFEGKPLAYAFGADKKADVKMYLRLMAP